MEEPQKNDDDTNKYANISIGSRGHAALKPLSSYMKQFFHCLQDAYDQNTNPQGYIALCIAENKLVQSKLESRLTQSDIIKEAFSNHPEVYCYNSFLGLDSAREGIAHFLTRKFLCPSQNNDANLKISPNQVAFGSGCAAFIHYLCLILAEEVDAVLIPAPYYAVFEADVSVSIGCCCFWFLLQQNKKWQRFIPNESILFVANLMTCIGYSQVCTYTDFTKRSISWANCRGIGPRCSKS